MRLALIGPSLSGKTTLFAAVTGHPPDPAHAVAERIGAVKVPEPRLELLQTLHHSKKCVEVTVEFVDVPGYALDSPGGPAEFRKHMPTLQRCDGLVAVVRAFESDQVPPYRQRIDPSADLNELHTELIFGDLEAATKRIERLEQQIQKPTPHRDQEKHELGLLQRCRECLEAEKSLAELEIGEEERRLISGFQFLTLKPMVAVLNVGEAQAAQDEAPQHPRARRTIALSAEIEAEIAALAAQDRQAFLADLGLTEPASAKLIHACYHAMDLISFLTANAEEAHAWSIVRGSTALEAAAKVHSDIARGFIRAETVAYDDLHAAGDYKAAKAAGKVRLEGKSYVVQDGDVILFRFNV